MGRRGCCGHPDAHQEWILFWQGEGTAGIRDKQAQTTRLHISSSTLTLSSPGFTSSAGARSSAVSSATLSEEGRLSSSKEMVEHSETVRALVFTSSWHQRLELPRGVPRGATSSMIRMSPGLLHTGLNK